MKRLSEAQIHAGIEAELRAEIERLKAALEAITNLCKTGPTNPFLADEMDRIARHALELKP